MPPSNANSFLAELAYDLEALRAMKRQIGASSEARQTVDAESRKDGSGNAKDALRSATASWLLGRTDRALAQLESAGDAPQAQLVRGLSRMESGDPIGAATSFSALVGTSLEGQAFFVELATAAALGGDADHAMKAARKLPEGADAAYAEGIALEAAGEYEEAKQRYQDAIHADPQHVRALFHLALRLDCEGEDARALELYRRAAAVPPGHVNSLLNMALLYEDAARYAEAESCYRRILASDPTHVRARIGIKDVLASQNMYYDEDHERREDRRAQVMRTPISEFELSVRSRNCLSRMDITTLGDLVRKSEAELLAYKNFGETSLQEIKDILAQKGLRLGMLRGSEDEAPLREGPSRAQAEAQLDALFGGADEEPDEDDPNDTSIDALELSIRARRCMDNLEIRTIGDLLRHSENELLASKNFGQTSLNEIRRKLESLGFQLRRK
ncbi:MAG: DNA-directed RNA polymerase subunit alpha C-terminal domain-containing protein [Planctomycetota bacterium]